MIYNSDHNSCLQKKFVDSFLFLSVFCFPFFYDLRIIIRYDLRIIMRQKKRSNADAMFLSESMQIPTFFSNS